MRCSVLRFVAVSMRIYILRANIYTLCHSCQYIFMCIIKGSVYLYVQGMHVFCNKLRCVAVCCGVLRCVAVCCSVLQCVAVCCSKLLCVAVCCSVIASIYVL